MNNCNKWPKVCPWDAKKIKKHTKKTNEFYSVMKYSKKSHPGIGSTDKIETSSIDY